MVVRALGLWIEEEKNIRNKREFKMGLLHVGIRPGVRGQAQGCVCEAAACAPIRAVLRCTTGITDNIKFSAGDEKLEHLVQRFGNEILPWSIPLP
jgi:hypothetical protein